MKFDDIRSRMRDVIAVPVTPFDGEDAIDAAAYRSLLHRLVDGGIGAITPNGNTGEFYALSGREWETITRLSSEEVGDRALLVPGIGYDLKTAVGMAHHAAGLGIPAVMVHQPLHPFQSPAGWVTYHQTIAGAAADLAIVPYIRETAVSPAMIQQVATACPNVVAVKYAVPDPVRFAEITGHLRRESVVFICGLAEMWAPFFWPAGASGYTSGLANVSPSISLEMLHCLRGGDYASAMKVWECIAGFEQLRGQEGSAYNVAVIKEALSQLGVCGRQVRPPASEVDEAQRARVGSILEAWNVKD